jgi:hypothetical protein
VRNIRQAPKEGARRECRASQFPPGAASLDHLKQTTIGLPRSSCPALKSGSMLLADRGYDADWIKTLARQHGAWANIPPEALSFRRASRRRENRPRGAKPPLWPCPLPGWRPPQPPSSAANLSNPALGRFHIRAARRTVRGRVAATSPIIATSARACRRRRCGCARPKPSRRERSCPRRRRRVCRRV